MSYTFENESLKAHEKLKGKIEITPKISIKSANDLKLFYTPGVGAVASFLSKNPAELKNLTIKGNSVAIVSDASAVLGLGNIGPAGAIPVMEGKAMLFKQLANVDAFPIILDTQDIDEIVRTVKIISPIFGGINLEDIAAPKCFEIEKRLIETLDIPVMHDDQHATAIIVLAGLMNASKVVEKELTRLKIVIVGAGAAGQAIAKILHQTGIKNILVLDSKGILSQDRSNLDEYKKQILKITNPENINGDLPIALKDSDAVIGVSGPDILKPDHLKLMGSKPIVFALANPTPEIDPVQAKEAGAYIVATGRSDFPNQVNNALVFPGIFRGALDNSVNQITSEMKIRAAHAIANLVNPPTTEKIVPSIFDPQVVLTVAQSIK